jgi:hypothetical protein
MIALIVATIELSFSKRNKFDSRKIFKFKESLAKRYSSIHHQYFIIGLFSSSVISSFNTQLKVQVRFIHMHVQNSSKIFSNEW